MSLNIKRREGASDKPAFKINKDFIKKYRVFIIFAVVVLLLEVSLFNYRFYESLSYKPVVMDEFDIDNSQADYMGNNTYKLKDDKAVINFKEINCHVNNIYLDIKNADLLNSKTSKFSLTNEKNKKITFSLKIDDIANSTGITTVDNNIVSTLERSKYKRLHLVGTSHDLSVTIKNAKGKNIRIDNIVLNKPVPFNFSVLRVLSLFVILSLLYLIKPSSKLYDYNLDFKNDYHKLIITCCVIVHIIILVFSLSLNTQSVDNGIGVTTQYQKLTNALLKGQVYLDDVPSEGLKNLSNPYDYGLRISKGVSYKWDHAYYEGKYYCYFGVVPAVVFNIPAKVLFGVDISIFTCYLILIPIFVIFSYLLIYSILKRYFSKDDIPILMYLILSALFVNGSTMFHIIKFADFYSFPVFMGITLTLGGLYFWLSSFKYDKTGKECLSPARIAIGSFLFALVAGCRPHYVLVAFLCIPIFFKSVFKDKILKTKNGLMSAVALILPVIIVAIPISYYNFARFGNITDFGATYNLTTNDLTHRGLILARLPLGFFAYLFHPPRINSVFPFMTNIYVSTRYMGYSLTEDIMGGIILIQPIMLFMILLPRLGKELKDRKLGLITVLILVFSLIIIAYDIELVRIKERVILDFAFLLYLVTVITIFAAYTKYKDSKEVKYIFMSFFVFLAVLSTISAFLIAIQFTSTNNPEFFYSLQNAIEFFS